MKQKDTKRNYGTYVFICMLVLLPFMLGCSPEEELIVPAPEVSGVESTYMIGVETDLLLAPVVASEGDVTYTWFIDRKEVANSSQYTFSALKPGIYELLLHVTNKGGTTVKEISITVKAGITYYETQTYTIVSLDAPEYFTNGSDISWEVIKTSSELYRLSMPETKNPLFVAAKEGEYHFKVSGSDMDAEVVVTVEKQNEPISPFIAKVYDYLPAPGQFVNKLPPYQVGDSRDDMIRKAGEYLIGEDASMVTLGGWGGYVTIGFDHTIVNVPGRRDVRVHGNAFAAAANPNPNAPLGGSSEPGIIMVAYDENKNGIPDADEWYEIKGSSNFTAENEAWYPMAVTNGNNVRTLRNFEMTYYRPVFETPKEAGEPNNPGSFATIQEYIYWTNNQGEEGYKIKNVYHSQSYYPAWIKEDDLTFKGIRLAQNGIDESGKGNYFVLYTYQHGYVDNYSNNHDNSAIDIDWAIDKDGNRVDLPGIDFIKIYTGVDQENGWLGEASTEVSRAEDLHMLGIEVKTSNY